MSYTHNDVVFHVTLYISTTFHTQSRSQSQRTADRPVHALRKVANVARVQTRHRNPSVRRHIHVRLLHHRLRLLPVHPRKTVASSAPARVHHNPAHLNIPICRVICPHLPGVCSSSVNTRYSSSRIEMIRCAIVLMSRCHSSNNSLSFRISAICTR